MNNFISALFRLQDVGAVIFYLLKSRGAVVIIRFVDRGCTCALFKRRQGVVIFFGK